MAEPWRAFDAAWFRRWQWLLLAILDEPILGRLARWVLCIRPGDVGYRGRILAILPHAYLVDRGDGSVTADFRTHAKYGKRIYYAFRPVWWALHAWDWAVADRLVPAWSCGFSTLTAYPDPDPETTTTDGIVARAFVSENWATLIAGAGSLAQDNVAAETILRLDSDATSNLWSGLYRAIFLFDTSSLTASAVVSSAVLSIYGWNKNDALAITPSLDIYTSTPASMTSLVAADFQQLGSTSQTGSPITYSAWSTAGYNDFTFNGTGLGNVSLTGISKFGARNANYDVAAVAPTWSASAQSSLNGYTADQTGTTNDPKLVVTYTVSGGASAARANWQSTAIVLTGAM